MMEKPVCVSCRYYRPYKTLLNLWGLLGGTYDEGSCALRDCWGNTPKIKSVIRWWESTYKYHPCGGGFTAFVRK